MSYTKRKLEELNVLDDFLLSVLAADEEEGEEFCRELLSILLQREIGQVKVITQKTIMALTPEHRGIRLDVEVNEEKSAEVNGIQALNVYDIESHLQNNTDFPRHNRFYQAKIDGRYLKSGEKDYMVYTVHNKCEEDPDLEYDDGLKFYYFNTIGTKGGNTEIRELLLYLKDSKEKNAVNENLKKIHQYVNKIKLRPEVREEYMRFDEIIEWERADAKTETKAEIILQILENYGEIPESLKERVMKQKDDEILDKMIRTAVKVKNIEQFEKEFAL